MQYCNSSALHWTFLSGISYSRQGTSLGFPSERQKFGDIINKLELKSSICVTDKLATSRVFLCKIYSDIMDSYLLLWLVSEVQKPVNY